MKLPIYSENIEILNLVNTHLGSDGEVHELAPSRGFEIYVDAVLVAYGPSITYWPEGSRT